MSSNSPGQAKNFLILLFKNSVRRSLPSSRGRQRRRTRDPLALIAALNKATSTQKLRPKNTFLAVMGIITRISEFFCVCRALSSTKMLKCYNLLLRYSVTQWITSSAAAKGRSGRTGFKELYRGSHRGLQVLIL